MTKVDVNTEEGGEKEGYEEMERKEEGDGELVR
jgi:hypothetical protein